MNTKQALAACAILALAGCASLPATLQGGADQVVGTLGQKEVLRGCAAADVITTAIAHSMGAVESTPMWKASIAAGHLAPFILGTLAFVAIVEWIDRPAVTAAASAYRCAYGLHNAVTIWRMK